MTYFVQERIITIDESEMIKRKNTTFEMVKQLLMHISGPLKASISINFSKMLNIMKEKGALETAKLAIDMMKALESLRSELFCACAVCLTTFIYALR